MAMDGRGRERPASYDAEITDHGTVGQLSEEDRQRMELAAQDMERFKRQFAEGWDKGKKNRERAEQDDTFLLGMDQWDSEQVTRRNGRPTLTTNKLPTAYHQIRNDLDQNAPGIQILPDDENDNPGHPAVAQVIEGHLRYISHRSNAIEHRLMAAAQAVSGGYGYYRINKVWASDRGFNQELRVQPVPNRSAVVDDPRAQEPDWRDRRYLFLIDTMDKDDAEQAHPHNSWTPGNDLGADLGALWSDRDVPRIEWWTREIVRYEKVESEEKDDAGRPKRTRQVPVYGVKCRITNGREVLLDRDGNALTWTWEGQWIPFMRVDGWKMNLKGEWHTEGAVHQARDSQRQYNYANSSMAEHFGAATKTQWTGPAGVFEGYEHYWRTGNTTNWGYLPFKLVPLPGGGHAKPERLDPPPAPAVLGPMIQNANVDLMQTLGMFQASRGESVNNESGYARQQVRAENDQGNYHYMKGLGVAMRFEADCLLDLLPYVYDTERSIRTRGEDAKVSSVKVNDDVIRELNAEEADVRKREAYRVTKDTQGRERHHYDLSVGRYSVVVNLGPSFATAREEARAGMDALLQRLPPQFAAILAPFYAKTAGWQDHEKIADAFMMLLPPEVQAVMRDDLGGDSEATARQLRNEVQRLKAMMQQAAQVIQQLQGELSDKQREQAVKVLEATMKTLSERLETISNITTAKMKAEAQVLTAGMRQGREALGGAAALHLDDEGDQALEHAAQTAQGMSHGGGNGGGR